MIACCVIPAAVVIAGLSVTDINYYPAIQMRLDEPLGIIGCFGFAVLAILPIIINTKEAIRWRYLRSAS